MSWKCIFQSHRLAFFYLHASRDQGSKGNLKACCDLPEVTRFVDVYGTVILREKLFLSSVLYTC